MAKIQMFKGYQGKSPVPKPKALVKPNIVTVQDGVPVKYPGCEGIGVRIVHPADYSSALAMSHSRNQVFPHRTPLY